MPAGTGQAHLALTAQVTNLVAEIVREHEKGPYMPGIIASCSKELMRVRSMTPRVWPNWHSIGHDDPRVLKHSWRSKIRAWEALGDHSGDLPVMPNPSIGPITVDLPSPPVIGNVAGSSTHATSELRDKGKGKAVVADPEPEVEGSRKRKSPMMSDTLPHLRSRPRRVASGSRQLAMSSRSVLVESEDDEDTIVQPISSGVPALNVPRPSTIGVGTPHSPRSPRSPKKQLFGPASLIAGSPPKVMATSGSRPEVVETPQVIFSFPAQTTPAIIAPRRSGPAPLGWTGGPVPHVCCASAAPPRRSNVSQHPWDPRQNIFEGSLPPGRLTPGHLPELPPMRQLPRSPKPELAAQSRGRSKTITAAKTPAPAPASIPSSSAAVPRLALDVPMPDLHSMAIAIWDGAARIALLEARVAEQDGMEPPSPKVQPASIIEGLIFELSQIQPEDPQTSGKLVDPDDPGNLVPEYDSDDMDVEVKVEPSADEVLDAKFRNPELDTGDSQWIFCECRISGYLKHNTQFKEFETYLSSYLVLGVTNWGGVTSDKEDKVKVQGTRSEYDQGFGLKDKSKRFYKNRD
ncbi:hypothetical protein BDR07DRAFT_1464188 [Suillus spraguei]|nr:hypothetical protein BDR07DRAFT_1464188 [Suillus spraguei]